MTLLETRSLTKRFGPFTAVNDVSLSFKEGQIHAILGENGAGKSTLMKLLFGLHSPTDGEILLRGKKVQWHSSTEAIENGLGMVQQHFSLVETVSAIDNIMLGAEVVTAFGSLDRKAAIAKIESLLPTSSLALPWESMVSDLTVGQKQRLEILKLLFRNAELLFLDEPTAVLTPQEIEDLFQVLRKLKSSGRTIILITHKMAEVFNVCDTYTVLRHGRVMSRGMVKDANQDLIVENMIGHKLEAISEQRLAVSPVKIFECNELRDQVSKGETVRGSLRGVSMNIGRGEIVGIAGIEGSGQSRLVDTLMGLRAFSGEMKILGQRVLSHPSCQSAMVRQLGVGLVPEDRHAQGLWLEESCFSNMIIGQEKRFVRFEIFDRVQIRRETTTWAKAFDVRTASLENPVSSLSGGNQQKIVFAREVIGRKPRLLVCHQPTRGVDLGAIDLIHRKILELRNEGVGVLLLSSELDELITLCDRIYVFYEGQATASFSRGSFDRLAIGAAMTGSHHVS